MLQTATSADVGDLQFALEHNEFDIAGLADFCADQKCVDQCLRQLYQIICRRREPNAADKRLLAQVLVGILVVARHDYAAGGYQEYWPFLFEWMRRATFAEPRSHGNASLSTPQNQALLGRWFLTALEAFGYSIPTEGQTYLGPIVFHAGVPSASLSGVLSAISFACDQFGTQAVSLPADIRAGLVKSRCVLHRNAERLFSSNLQGAAQLWGCLARVVLAWNAHGDCNDELQRLPLALDPVEVRAALPSPSETAHVARTALPQMRYDSDTGETRLTIPSETSTQWTVTSAGLPVKVKWIRTHLGQSAEFVGPPPETILVKPADPSLAYGRSITPYPSLWPGCWFHAHNGNLEDGPSIDASGLGPGRWYVIFEGTPTKCSVPPIQQIPLNWSWFQGNQDWTAWEVEVPRRAPARTHLEWFVGDNCFRVPLARRPGAKVEFVDPSVARASTPDGIRLDVYADAPTVVLRREAPLSLLLLRESSDSVAVTARFDLRPETVTRLPVSAAGIYQLRESRGVGRTLLRFAIVPELQIQGPEFDAHRQRATIKITADDGAGKICDEGNIELTRRQRHWVVNAATVEPMLRLRWRWLSEDTAPLVFRWPLEALRWRIGQAGDEDSAWRRGALFISPQVVSERDAQLEIQKPAGSELIINGTPYTGRSQPSPTGDTCVISLHAYGETVELEQDGRRRLAVVISERPLLSSFQGAADSNSVTVTWRAEKIPTGIVVVAWDPGDMLAAPCVRELSQAELRARKWKAACGDLPGDSWTAITLARYAGGFVRRIPYLAAHRANVSKPVSLLWNRVTGQITYFGGQPTDWAEFLHHVGVLRLNRNAPDCEAMAEWLSARNPPHGFDVGNAIRLLHGLERRLNDQATPERDREWARVIHRAVQARLRRDCEENPAFALSQSDAPDYFDALLKVGIPIGRSYPFRSIESGDLPPAASPYPIEYIRDLWLLGGGRHLLAQQPREHGVELPRDFGDTQTGAACRVLQFHVSNSLPPISAFLPLGRRAATADATDRGHRHGFALPPLPASLESLADVCEALGLRDKALDCEATVDDQFFDVSKREPRTNANGRGRSPGANKPYSLYWSANENRWYIETLHRSPPTCCATSGGPLAVEPISGRELAIACVRDALARWTRDERLDPADADVFAFLGQYRDSLVSDDVGGGLHAEIFRSAEIETKELFGAALQVETRAALAPLAMVVWQLAWMDRAAAWQGEMSVFQRTDDEAWFRREFLGGLALANTRWPTLMRRTIALAELVYWTLYRGGLGSAARFRGGRTEAQSAERRNPAASHPSVPAAPIKQSGHYVSGVAGVIIGYDAGQGTILLRHHSSPSLKATLRDYLTHGDSSRHWLAKFHWRRALNEDVRERLQRMHSQRATQRTGYLSLADVMCGMQVTCDLQKMPKWEAVRMEISFTSQTLEIPRHQRRQPH